ncbi:hypothetical protein RHGRI_004624 [Rhododendron griersonianum]|uniref:Uncharacterized protein n=1 Tax=Rhododendron griersonianum TaxID=479676 RepID=A0AAV6LBP4_9ERIC|nr:hypothetical protein RHGRI_004624 [Rhododendron griersonianum]
MSKSSTVMAKQISASAGHPEDFIPYAPFTKTPAEFLGSELYDLVMGFKPVKGKQSHDKNQTCTAEAGCSNNGDGDEEDSVAWEETRKDRREKERGTKLLKHKLAREITIGRKG